MIHDFYDFAFVYIDIDCINHTKLRNITNSLIDYQVNLL